MLTPQEADEVLGALRDQAHAGACTVLMITHKFREVMAYADDVSVLRSGALVATGAVSASTPESLAHAMVGEGHSAPPPAPAVSARRASPARKLEIGRST